MRIKNRDDVIEEVADKMVKRMTLGELQNFARDTFLTNMGFEDEDDNIADMCDELNIPYDVG